MWYALIDLHSDTNAATWLAYGTLQDIADVVIEQCINCEPDGNDTLDIDAIEEDGWHCYSDDYLMLKEADTITPDLLQQFTFELSDCDVQVKCLAEGYAAFKTAFEAYEGRNLCLGELQLPNHVAEDEEVAFAEELEEVLFEDEYMFGLRESRRYVSLK